MNFAGLSVTHTFSVSGSPTIAVSDAAMPSGGPVWTLLPGPAGSKRSIGGVLPIPFSSNGST